MSFSLLTKLIVDELTDLSPELLKSRKIRLLMMDFDNTIVPYTTNVPTEKMAAWLTAMNGSDIQLCVVSNSHNDRVPTFCRKYGIDCIVRAKKPAGKGIRQCLSRYQIPADEAALVGDQIDTDVLGGNCAGVQSILVKAICNHNLLLKARHVLELPFISAARNRKNSP